MPTRTVARSALDTELRKIEREGVERLVSVVPADASATEYEVRTETLDEPPLEVR